MNRELRCTESCGKHLDTRLQFLEHVRQCPTVLRAVQISAENEMKAPRRRPPAKSLATKTHPDLFESFDTKD